MMDINYELYKVFYFVATTLSFSQASRQLYISQSAVSNARKTLEKKLGHTLFIRSTKKVILTAEAELLLQHGKVRLDSDLIENSENGYETIVRMGERIGKCKLPKRA